ncbi:hypothetical protein Agub_g6903 [Astrephomene gubernaculifera]|uniref:Uncharacterized protein n=1 Tax=Astrephomene gubernaculifera TaxID=47775 RepID=A0AAD3DR98_9CHLO|nr:hypothetical protein Agub_g6903 [Astrephomene gubernaculifera]
MIIGALVAGVCWSIGAVVLSCIAKAIGFSAIGPVAGSLAAKWMSGIAIAKGGGVAAGSIYALLQSFAMGGGRRCGAVTACTGAVGTLFVFKAVWSLIRALLQWD